MKKLLLLFILFLGIHFSASSQSKDLIELKVTKDSTLVQGTYSYAINLSILGDKGPYNIDIYDNRPIAGGKLITSRKNSSEATIRFDNLQKTNTLYISVECIQEHRGITTMIRL